MNLTSTSKFVSLILRHKPETIGIQLDEHGWANVDELIAGISKTREFNREILDEIVRTDNKQRFTFNEDKTKIRANQGHSISGDVELPEAIPPETLWHGTGEKYVASIDKQGLIPKGRLYVHLSSDTSTATKVGSRHGKPVLYIVKTKEMHDDGYKFFLSKNGVWLTKEVPVKYLVKSEAVSYSTDSLRGILKAEYDISKEKTKKLSEKCSIKEESFISALREFSHVQ